MRFKGSRGMSQNSYMEVEEEIEELIHEEIVDTMDDVVPNTDNRIDHDKNTLNDLITSGR